jgi:hypothetical protein
MPPEYLLYVFTGERNQSPWVGTFRTPYKINENSNFAAGDF